ncbi:MAG: tRNA (adenosine(37)-N6)-threonylcarbamoyltransferase complex dimerization subunit type 1 TsaB [Thermoanaerobaculia bacterium]
MRLLLALDAGSPTVSVAVGPPGEPRVERSVEIRRSSERLLEMVDECLREVGAELRELDGVVALRGPGSFTGLRVGLATALGFHQALELPVAAVPTLEVLALHGVLRARGDGGPPPGATVVAAVDALRGEWFVQPFRAPGPAAAPEPLDEPRIAGPPEVLALEPVAVVGFGVHRVAEALAEAPAGTPAPLWIEPDALAADALRLAALRSLSWDGPELTAPLYLRPPAVSQPRR